MSDALRDPRSAPLLVPNFLMMRPRFGPGKAGAVCRGIPIAEHRRVREITSRQRAVLEALTEWLDEPAGFTWVEIVRRVLLHSGRP